MKTTPAKETRVSPIRTRSSNGKSKPKICPCCCQILVPSLFGAKGHIDICRNINNNNINTTTTEENCIDRSPLPPVREVVKMLTPTNIENIFVPKLLFEDIFDEAPANEDTKTSFLDGSDSIRDINNNTTSAGMSNNARMCVSKNHVGFPFSHKEVVVGTHLPSPTQSVGSSPCTIMEHQAVNSYSNDDNDDKKERDDGYDFYCSIFLVCLPLSIW